MKHGDEFQPFSSNAIWDEEGRAGDHQFLGSQDAASALQVRLTLQEFDGSKDLLRNIARRRGGVPRNVLPEGRQVCYRPAGPDHLHRGVRP